MTETSKWGQQRPSERGLGVSRAPRCPLKIAPEPTHERVRRYAFELHCTGNPYLIASVVASGFVPRYQGRKVEHDLRRADLGWKA